MGGEGEEVCAVYWRHSLFLLFFRKRT